MKVIGKLAKLECGLQIECVTWLRKRFELTGETRFNYWHHSPNQKAGFLEKMMGVNKGFPDLINLELKIAVEFKVNSGLSREQRKWKAYLIKLGFRFYEIRSLDEFKQIFLIL